MQRHTISDDKPALDKYVETRDPGAMELLVLVAVLVVLDVLAALYGYDSRVLDPRTKLDWWPGA
jgi:hypothetical protein